jgi:hypothetical protein
MCAGFTNDNQLLLYRAVTHIIIAEFAEGYVLTEPFDGFAGFDDIRQI